MNLFKSFLYNFINLIILFLIGLLANVLIVKLIGVEGKGILSVYNAFFGLFLNFSFLSLGSGLIYHVNKTKDPGRYLNSGLLFSILLSGIIILILLACREIFLSIFFKDIPKIYYDIGIGFIFLDCVNKVTIAFSAAMRGPKIYNYGFLINKIVYVATIVLIWFSGISVKAIHIILIATGAAIIHSLYILVQYKPHFGVFSARFAAIRSMLTFSLKEHIGVVAQKLNLKLDILIMSIFLSATEIGYYSIAVLFAQLIWYVPNSIGVFLYPQIVYKDDHQHSAYMTTKINRINLAFVIAVGIVSFVLIGDIIVFLFGESFYRSAEVFRVLVFGTMGLSPAKILTKYFSGIGKPILNSQATALGLIINIPLLLILITNFGILGAAYATSISYIIISLYVSILFLKDKNRLRLTVKDLLFITKDDLSELLSKIKMLKVQYAFRK